MELSILKRCAIVILWFVITLGLMVAAAYLWVFIYSVFINNTGTPTFYEDYAQIASPIVAVCVALPIFYMMGRYMRRYQAAITLVWSVLAIHIGMEILVQLSLQQPPTIVVICSILAAILKVLGAYLGMNFPAQKNHGLNSTESTV